MKNIAAAVIALGAAAMLSLLCGCDRAGELYERLVSRVTSHGHGEKNPRVSDAERVIGKFGAPRERLGVGRAVHSEHGIRYNRKWNYYYARRPGEKPCMRTVYFVDDAFTGSVVRRPDGTVQAERLRFAY